MLFHAKIGRFSSILLLSFLIFNAKAQLPQTQLYLADLKFAGQTAQFKNLTYLNTFNPSGYNNQPFFFGYNDLYLSAAIDTQQKTDIYKLDISKKIITRFTATENISEFSPLPVPASDDLSVIRIEADGKTQSLWVYPKDGSNIGKRLFKDVDNPGYYYWLTSLDVALFLVGNPHQLAIGNLASGKLKVIATNPGRCLRKNSNGHLVFVDKSDEKWYLKSWSPANEKFSVICQMPVGSEDFEILPNGYILTGNGSKILMYDTGKNQNWVECADFSSLQIRKINRLSSSRDRLVFVAEK